MPARRGAGTKGPIFISTGEASGDLYGGLLARALKVRSPRTPLEGFGGTHMRRAGVRADSSLLKGAVMGFTGVFRHLGLYISLLRSLRRRWTRRPPRAVVLIDFPGFNLRVGGIARRLGIPVYYYVCPQVWAWGAKRLLRMRDMLRRAFLILPFEEPLYSAYGVNASFVGHPLLETLPERLPPRRAVLRAHGFDPGRPLGVILPGSRSEELRRHCPMLAEALRMAGRVTALSRIQWAVIAAPGTTPASFGELAGLARVVADPGCRLRASAALSWTASGTATLETGLLGVPQAVFYRTGALNAFIVLKVLGLRRASLVNLVLGRDAVPELLQSRATPGAMVAESRRLFTGRERARARAEAGELRRLLGGRGASRAVADAVLRGGR